MKTNLPTFNKKEDRERYLKLMEEDIFNEKLNIFKFRKLKGVEDKYNKHQLYMLKEYRRYRWNKWIRNYTKKRVKVTLDEKKTRLIKLVDNLNIDKIDILK